MDISQTASFRKFHSCTTSQLEVVQNAAEGALNATMLMLSQQPKANGEISSWQLAEGLLLFFSLSICFFGYRLVRLVNLLAGMFLGSTVALFSLELVAPHIAQETCVLVVLITLAAAVIVGFLCVIKRQSLYFVLGVIAAQVVGDTAYGLLLYFGYGSNSETAPPEDVARGCISFFAVLGATLVFFYADLAWNICTAVAGGYGTVFFSIKLLVIPYAPSGEDFAAFTTFRPATIRDAASISVFVYLPFAASLFLAIFGFITQSYCSKSIHRNKEKLLL